MCYLKVLSCSNGWRRMVQIAVVIAIEEAIGLDLEPEA